MSDDLRAIRAAFAYFSVLPVGRADAPDPRAVAWLPLVGAAVGALAGGAGTLAARVAPPPVAVATAFGASIALSGAIHVDGFLDAADALFASVAPERRLEILRDPRHGSYAVAGFAVAAAAWLAALAALPPRRYPLALAQAGCAARLLAVLNARRVPPARPGTASSALAQRPPALPLALGGALALGLALPLGRRALAALPLALLASRGAADWARGRLGGGLTGDVYGFLIVALDVALLLAAAD